MNQLEKLKLDLYASTQRQFVFTLQDLQGEMDDAITKAYDLGVADGEKSQNEAHA